MAPISLRRSRALESDEEEETSRQSTPASTAPQDGKRARRSLIRSDGDGDQDNADSSTSELKNRKTQSKSQLDQKPVFQNGTVAQKPRHQPGAIVRIKLTNFVTYTFAEFLPGPNLNMVIGPNGTGKSTLVCAICLGLGWGTQFLGRAKDAAEFVKHGCREAVIEIELQRALRGKNMSRTNPVITRTIKREGNKSTYTLNGQTASGKAVTELARSFDIQIDNLCQFLPQDKVVEFAQMTPIEILQSTQRAAAPPSMIESHNNLKELRKAQKESNNHKKNDRDMLVNLENRQEMQRIEVERLRERAVVQKRLSHLEKCRPVPQYSEAKNKSRDAKQRAKTAAHERKQLEDEVAPTLRRVNGKQKYAGEIEGLKKEREKEVKVAEMECNRLAKIIDNHNTTMKDCDGREAAEKRSAQTSREDVNRIRLNIASLNKRRETAPEPFDSRAMNEHIQDRVTKVRELDDQIEELRSKAEDMKGRGIRLGEQRKRAVQNLTTLSTEVGRQEDLLKSKSDETYRAWDWIKKNRDKFRKPVYGPPMVECSVKDHSVANRIESLLQDTDFRIITVQCTEDFRMLQNELNGQQRLHDISIRTCPFESLDNFKSPLSREQMRDYGLRGWAIDCLEGPTPVLAMLCQEKFLHQCGLTDSDISQAQHDQLSALPAVKSYISRTNSYQFTRRAEYGAAGVQSRVRALRPARIWTNQPVNVGRRQQLENEIRELLPDIQEVKEYLAERKKENDGMVAEREKLNEEIKQIREEKEEKQKALTEYNALETKIANEEQRLTNAQATLDTMRARLEEIHRERDSAMFAKADIVLQYCEAVHSLQEKTKALIEIEVAFIEAKNDWDVLAARNDHVAKVLREKQEEEKRAGAEALAATQIAKILVEEVKKLRIEAAELEEKEHDRSFLDVLQEISSISDPKESDLDDMIKVEQAKLELTEGGDVNTINEFEERAKRIESLRARLTKTNSKQQELLDLIRETREQWEGPLDALVAKISDAFGESFARIGCAGQVTVYKASSDDPADCTEELGGHENGLDFANWAVHISVKFREHEPLSLLDSHRQSGGERAVSTIFYLMALQSLSRAPFRVVDEINQGMDPRNERMVHGRMVDIAAADEHGNGQGSQYFLITPKLLSGLKYKAGMTVLCIVSGENMPSVAATRIKDETTKKWVTKPGKKIDFAEFIRKARSLGLNRAAGKRIDSGIGMGRSFDSLGTLGRSPTPVA